MANTKHFSAKHLAIDKANAILALAVGMAAFITVFSLVASNTLISQRAYQAKVIKQKRVALKQLRENTEVVKQLSISYQEFAGKTENILGDDAKSNTPNGGENPRIVLDALPSRYDFPALTTSIERLLKDKQFTPTNITGTDDEIAQAANLSSSTPIPVEMPFSVEVPVSSESGKSLIQLFELSIRPLQVQKLSIIGQKGQLKLTLTGKTFFQPEKNLNIKTEVVK